MAKRPEKIAIQSSKPSGLLGRIIGNIMALETTQENGATLDLLELQQNDRLLEIGFGHGKTIKRAASLYSGGKIYGVDHSELMVQMASRRNEKLIKAGRIELVQSDTTTLPYPNDSFEKIFSVHTIYFWEEPNKQFKEIHRVLKTGGKFILCFRYDNEAKGAFPPSIYKFRTADEINNIIKDNGFTSVKIETANYSSRILYWIIATKN